MSHSFTDTSIRDALYQHEMFDAQAGGSSYGIDHIRQVEDTWPFGSAEIESQLAKMEDEGLVQQTERHFWHATPEGLLARERRWQQRGRRHASLRIGMAELEDLVIALIASGGSEHEGFGSETLLERALGTYLLQATAAELHATTEKLIADGVVRRYDSGLGLPRVGLLLSADGRRHYAQVVVPRLGLCLPLTILATSEQERLPFEELGLTAALADNLRYRWEEAARCMDACAWLAATALFGSILEVVLPDWLRRDEARARGAKGAPRGQGVPLEQWRLAELIKVAVELEFIDASLARHAQALRESRNLIHPDKNIRERSTPDGNLAAISRQVVLAVLDALARAAPAQGNPLGCDGTET